MDEQAYVWGTGRRKCAIARVRLFPGDGKIIVNDKPYQEVFSRLLHRQLIEAPGRVTETIDRYDTIIKIRGGGLSGQATAIQHGIARALVKQNELFRSLLRQEGLLTRDSRVKERKKYGLKRARKGPQYTKR